MKSKKQDNYSILSNLKSFSRRKKFPPHADYIIIYTFLYKYCSDNFKEFLLHELKDKELTIDEAYNSKYFHEALSLDALNLYGFYFTNSEAFIDETVKNNYDNPKFLSDFLKIFPKNIVFSTQYHNLDYFNELFRTIFEEINFTLLEFPSEENNNLIEIINLISQLDIFDSQLSFEDVFDIIASSVLLRIPSNSQYVTQILSQLVLSEKNIIESVYDPFLKDGNNIIRLFDNVGYGLSNVYGKDESKLNYLYNIVKFFINDISLNNVFLKQEDALESIDINGKSFDVILSRVPIAIKNYHSGNVNQNLEISKRNKRHELENILLKNFDIDGDSFTQDMELNNALENLLDKMDIGDMSDDLTGEYESLKDSEFLFLINLIESLKKDGLMVISISQNLLFKNSLRTLRKYLTEEKNYIDAIISIPSDMGRPKVEVVIVFRKNKETDDVLFIDMSKKFQTQRGFVFSKIFKRQSVLADETLEKLSEVYKNKLTVDKYSKLISLDSIRENDYNLSVSKYVDTFEGEFIKLNELSSEKEEIDLNLSRLNLKIEEMMDELNIRF